MFINKLSKSTIEPDSLPCRLLTATVLCAMLIACAPVKMNLKSQVQVPQNFKYANSVINGKGQSQQWNIDQWWLSWHDPVLTQLITAALNNNKDLAKTFAKLEQVRSQVRLAKADLGSMVGANINAGAFSDRAHSPLPDSVRQPLSVLDSSLGDSWQHIKGSLVSGGIGASWEPDFFGAKQSDADAAYYGSLAQEELWHATQMLLTTDVAQQYYQRQYFLAKQQLNQQQVKYLKRLQSYVQGRFDAGQATAYNIQEIRSNLQAAQAAGVTFKAQADHALRQLAVLTGQVPQQFQISQATTQSYGSNIPAPPTDQTPANVLNQRPDIRALQNQVYARSAQLASAKADLLPRFTLNFLGQSGRLRLDSNAPALVGVGGLVSLGIELPIFTAGRIQANIDANDANLKAALYEYDNAVLKALNEVDSAYQAQFALNQQQQQFDQALASSKKQANSAARLFKYDDSNLDTVIQTNLQSNKLQDQALDIIQARINNMLDLYKAIGAGWNSKK